MFTDSLHYYLTIKILVKSLIKISGDEVELTLDIDD